MSSTSAASSVTVILKSRDDWQAWYSHISRSAKVAGVWDYLNPEVKADERPKVPKYPDLPAEDATEKAFKMYDRRWNHAKFINSKIQDIDEAIQRSIALPIQQLVKDKLTAEVLSELKQQFEPTTLECELKASNEYVAALTAPIKQGKISQWLQIYENAYREILSLKQPESGNRTANISFLKAISRYSLSYAERNADRLNREGADTADHLKLVSEYRQYLSTTDGFVKSSAGQVAFATLGGESDKTSELKPSAEKVACPCGCKRGAKYCFHFMHSRRPDWYRFNDSAEKKVSEALKRTDEYGRKLQEIKAYDNKVMEEKKKRNMKPQRPLPIAQAAVEEEEHYVQSAVHHAPPFMSATTSGVLPHLIINAEAISAQAIQTALSKALDL
ncbi:hypothetical protein BDW66DRAFT_163892 [Aspergillus desertorum]